MSSASGVASLLWVEGVDFSQTLYDTNQLSVVRGASLTLLAIGKKAEEILKPFGAELIFSGASQALFKMPCDETAAQGHLATLLNSLSADDGKQPPFRHMQWVGGVAADDNSAKAPRLAQGRARLMQMNGTAPRRALEPGAKACAFSANLPGSVGNSFSIDRAKRYGVADGKPMLAPSTKARYDFGRAQRKDFYTNDETGGYFRKAFPNTHSFTDNLQDMVTLGAGEAEAALHAALPVSLRNKVAIFYADGNSFGALRDALGGHAEALREFSSHIQPVMGAAAAAVLGAVAKGAYASEGSVDYAASVFYDKEDSQAQIRFETLLYGGDEVCFVAPSWFGLGMANAFFDSVKMAKPVQVKGEDMPLTFKAGLVFAPAKMPIALGQALVKDLANSVKRDGNSLGVQAFESLDPPKGSIAGLRKRLLGIENEEEMLAHAASDLVVLNGNTLGDTLDALAALTGDEGIPRSQLYRILQQGMWMQEVTKNGKTSFTRLATPRKLSSTQANAICSDVFNEYLKKNGKQVQPDSLWENALASPERAAVAAFAITQLWDYVDPVARAQQ